MTRHDPSLAVAHKVSIQSRQEPEMFDQREAIERKVHDLHVLATDLVMLSIADLKPHRAELSSSMTKLELICSALVGRTLQAAE